MCIANDIPLSGSISIHDFDMNSIGMQLFFSILRNVFLTSASFHKSETLTAQCRIDRDVDVVHETGGIKRYLSGSIIAIFKYV
jgi:hypothetical protein